MTPKFQNKRVFVTGAAGFIGSNLVHRLVVEGAQVYAIDSFIPECGSHSFNLEPILPQIHFERMDLRDWDRLAAILKGFDFIFNLAGNVSHQNSMSHPLDDMDLNIRAQLTLLEICRKQNKEAVVVFSSTRQIYGVPQYLPVDENHPIEPVDVNGINKLAAERYHRLYARVHGLKTVSLRLTNTYGPRQLITHHRQGFIGWFINRAITGNPIQLFGGGEQVRDFNYVDDVVEAMMLSALNERCYGESFNLSGERSSLKNVAEMLVKLSGRGTVEPFPFPQEQKKIDIGDYYGTSDRIKQITGWSPKIPLKEGLEKTLKFYLTHRHRYLDQAS